MCIPLTDQGELGDAEGIDEAVRYHDARAPHEAQDVVGGIGEACTGTEGVYDVVFVLFVRQRKGVHALANICEL